MSLSKTLYPLLSTGSTPEDRKTSLHDLKIVDWDVFSIYKPTNKKTRGADNESCYWQAKCE